MTRREWLAVTAATPLAGRAAPAAPIADSTQFRCEDLSRSGLLLVTPDSTEYGALLADILERQAHPAKGSPHTSEENRPTISESERGMSAILINRSQRTVVSLAAVWRFDRTDGSSYRHIYELIPPDGLLLPFGWSESVVRLNRYWKAILPGSKRYLTDDPISGGRVKMIGDNTDVRLPRPDEMYSAGAGGSGGGRVGGRGGRAGAAPIRQVTLTLDGAFFDDGEFVGPDREGLWERTVCDAEARVQIAKIARDGHNNGLPSNQIVAAVKQLTGPPPGQPPILQGIRDTPTMEKYRQWALQNIAYQLESLRRFGSLNDEREVSRLMAWSDVALPSFRRE
jgi:hypothetical protein